MGGLITGALLSCAGSHVTVLEKNAIIGGGLQSFKRHGAWFNTGMHNFGGFGEQWALSHLFRYLGIKDELHVLPVDPEAQEIVWTDETHSYRLPRGREAFEHYLGTLFPSQQEGLHRYLDALYLIADSFDLYYLRRSQTHPDSSVYEGLTVEQLMRQFIDDEELIRVLSYLTPLCGHSIDRVPVSVHSMLSVLYLDGEYRFEDNALQLAQALRTVIERHGGQVVALAEVSDITVHEGHVEKVTTTDGREWTADKYIASIAPSVLFALLTEDVVRKVSRRRADSFMVDSSALSIYIRLKENSFPFINSTIFLPVSNPQEGLPSYILLTTPPVQQQGSWAHTMEILVPCRFTDFAQWGDRPAGERPQDYQTYKHQRAQEAIDYVSRFYPVRQAVEHVTVGTPLTIRDYYYSPNGALFSQQGLFMPLRTRTDNLFFTGQSILYHGLCGVPLTAILTAEAVSEKDLLTPIIQAGQ